MKLWKRKARLNRRSQSHLISLYPWRGKGGFSPEIESWMKEEIIHDEGIVALGRSDGNEIDDEVSIYSF